MGEYLLFGGEKQNKKIHSHKVNTSRSKKNILGQSRGKIFTYIGLNKFHSHFDQVYGAIVEFGNILPSKDSNIMHVLRRTICLHFNAI